MSILATRQVAPRKKSRAAKSVRFTDTMLYIRLTDGREIGVPLTRFLWLKRATPTQRSKWRIEPHGLAVYWDDLDDGIEIDHLLE